MDIGTQTYTDVQTVKIILQEQELPVIVITADRHSTGERSGMMKIDIFKTEEKYDILYTDPPWQQGRGGKQAKKLELFARTERNSWDQW